MSDQTIKNRGEFQQRGFLTRPEVEAIIGQKMSHTREVMNVGNAIRSLNFETGVAGFQIDANGNAEFNDATMRGTIVADDGTIGGWTIGDTSLSAEDNLIVLNSSGSITMGSSAGTITTELSNNLITWKVGSTDNAIIRLLSGSGGPFAGATLRFNVGGINADSVDLDFIWSSSDTGVFRPASDDTINLGDNTQWFNEVHYDTLVAHTQPAVARSEAFPMLKSIMNDREGRLDKAKLHSKLRVGTGKNAGLKTDVLLLAAVEAVSELEERVKELENAN